MKKMIMNETVVAYGIVAMLILFALLTSCAAKTKTINMGRGYKNPTGYHRTPPKTGDSWINVK